MNTCMYYKSKLRTNVDVIQADDGLFEGKVGSPCNLLNVRTFSGTISHFRSPTFIISVMTLIHTLCHLADAFIQSDLQLIRLNRAQYFIN